MLLQEDGREDGEVKKKRFDEGAPVPEPGNPSPGQLTTDKVFCCFMLT